MFLEQVVDWVKNDRLGHKLQANGPTGLDEQRKVSFFISQ